MQATSTRTRGRPLAFSPEQRNAVVALASSHPADHALAGSRWSLRSLSAFVMAAGIVDHISHEGLRMLLLREGIALGQPNHDGTQRMRMLADEPVVAGHHVVQLYEGAAALVDTVCSFLGAGLMAGQPALVVATRAHSDAFDLALRAAGIDLAEAGRTGRYRSIDAGDLLAQFMVGGLPDPDRFDRSVGALIRAMTGPGQPLRAYGEMVALLWEQGNVAGAMALEDLWSELGSRTPFALHCAYPSGGLDGSSANRRAICERHTGVVAGPWTPSMGTHEVIRRFEPTPLAAPYARRFVTDTIGSWECDDVVDAAEVVVSELVGNAVRHGQRRFLVSLAREHEAVRIGVTDPSPQVPLIRPGSDDAIGGRGMHLVAALSRRWGTRLHDGGKTVWAELVLGP